MKVSKKVDPFQVVLDFYFEHGGTYEKLANEFKVSKSTVNRWRNDESMPVEMMESIIRRILDFELEDVIESNYIIN